MALDSFPVLVKVIIENNIFFSFYVLQLLF